MNESASAPENCKRGRIFFVRHAQSAANAGGRTADTATVPITDTGICQAQCVADLVSERPSAIVVSRYLRTFQTGAALLRRYPGVPVEQWPVEEFTYLDTGACARTSYAERKDLRDAYWKRCDPLWVDGPGCECFADFIARVHHFEQALSVRDANQSVVVFTHGLLMQAMLWFRQYTSAQVTGSEMSAFDRFRRSVSVPNCAVLRASSDGSGRLRLSTNVFIDHISEELRTE